MAHFEENYGFSSEIQQKMDTVRFELDHEGTVQDTANISKCKKYYFCTILRIPYA